MIKLDFPRLRKRVPFFASSENAECGLACVAMISAYHSSGADLESVRQSTSVSLQGLTARGLVQIADRVGLTSRVLRADLDELRDVSTPAILHWNLNHFVVLERADERGVDIIDPNLGRRRLSYAQVSGSFTGVVVELGRVNDFNDHPRRTSVHLSSLWSRATGLKRSVVQVVLLSVLLQALLFLLPLQAQIIIDRGIRYSDQDLLALVAVCFGLIVLFQAAAEVLRNWSLVLLGSSLTYQVVGNVVRHLTRLPVSYFEKRNVGDIVSRMASVQAIQDILTRGLLGALLDGALAVVALGILLTYSASLTGVVLASIVLSLFVSTVAYPHIKAGAQEQLIASAAERSFLLETLRAATPLKVMGGGLQREGGWRNLFLKAINASARTAGLQATSSAGQSLMMGLGNVAVLYLGARQVLHGSMTLGMFVSFLAYRQLLSDRALNLVGQVSQFRLISVHLDRLSDIVLSPADPPSRSELPAISGAIEARRISFRYGDAEPWVIRDFDLVVPAGGFLALTGPSGGGKTTLVKLLLGLHAPQEGTILLDGTPAEPDLWAAWRQQVGVVAQDDRLLSGSLAENIAFFDPDADIDRIQRAASLARIHTEIMVMPMRYETLVGDMGSSLSGGQKQRLLIARALYREPRVLFLDEGTANLDLQSELAIADLISSLPITRVVVAHRPALIERAMQVVEISNWPERARATAADVLARKAQ